jgi:NADPH2:quinone reductase
VRHELDPDRSLQTIADDWLLYRSQECPSEAVRRRETITKAIRVHETGAPDVLSVEEVPVPKPSEGEGLVKLEAVGVNFIDVNQRSGAYNIALPFTPGTEGAGVVADTGPGVSEVSVGDRVAFAGEPGAYAEYVVVKADRLVPVLDDVTTEQAGAVMLQGMTAHYLLTSICTFEEGDWCLVHAAAGGVGLLLTQMARRQGLRVVGTVSTSAKAEKARAAGADHVVIYSEEDFESAVRDVTKGGGVRAVYESVGKTTFDDSLRCLAPRGYLILFGQTSGPVDPVDPRRLQQGRSLFLTRPGLVDYISTRDDLLWRSREVLSLVAEGGLHVHVHARFDLEAPSEAHRALESRATIGKLILAP